MIINPVYVYRCFSFEIAAAAIEVLRLSG